MSYTKYDSDILKITKDPVLWAEHHLKSDPKDTGPRWYQQQILRHPHNRIVLRCGRRVGKCIEGSQRIINPSTGEYRTVESLYKENKHQEDIYTLDNDFKMKKSKTFYIEDNGVKDVFKVRTKKGNQVLLTGNHPLLTIDGWQEVDALKAGDYIATPKKIEVTGTIKKNDEYVRMLAYILATGTIFKNILSIEVKHDYVLKDLEYITKKLKIKMVKKSKRTYFLLEQDDYFKKLIEESNDRVPVEVFTYDKETLSKFLAAIFDSTGWISASLFSEFGMGSIYDDYIRDMKHLLLRYGIETNISDKMINNKPYYQLMIHKNRANKIFLDEIVLLYGKRDYTQLIKQVEFSSSKDYKIPKDIWKYLEESRVEKKMSKSKVVGNKDRRLRYTKDVTEELLDIYADNLEDIFLKDIANSDVSWDEIQSIEHIGQKNTYDVFVPETHNLVIEDIFVHNTWTMCAHMLWVAFTCNGGTVPTGATCVVATPYDNQARLIFDQLMTFIRNNDMLAASVKSSTKNPYIITWNNGSVIKLFTAGTKSGGEGGALRGQKADWLYMDKQLCPFI